MPSSAPSSGGAKRSARRRSWEQANDKENSLPEDAWPRQTRSNEFCGDLAAAKAPVFEDPSVLLSGKHQLVAGSSLVSSARTTRQLKPSYVCRRKHVLQQPSKAGHLTGECPAGAILATMWVLAQSQDSVCFTGPEHISVKQLSVLVSGACG